MISRVILPPVLLLIVAGGVAYSNQDKVLLALIKYKSVNEYDIGPPRELAWEQGPVHGSGDAGSRPPNIDDDRFEPEGYLADYWTNAKPIGWGQSSRPGGLTQS